MVELSNFTDLNSQQRTIAWSLHLYIVFTDEVAEKTPVENIHELYRILMQRSALENAGLGETPLEHLMIRKSQRSPSLRLRFGRSDPRSSVSI